MVMLMHDLPPSTSQDPLQSALESIDERSDTVLDDNILDDDARASDMAAHYDQRPEAFGGNQVFLSAGQPAWQEIPQNNDVMPFNPMNQPHHFLPANPNSQFHHQAETSPPTADYGDTAWQHQSNGNTLASTPHSAVFGTFPPDSVKGEESYSNHFERQTPHAMPMSTTSDHHQYAPSATSPQSDNGWMSTSSSDPTERLPKREQLSPLFDHNPPRLRPDGVRKKNARFEIPEDRKVDTIDKIIMQCDPTDENLLKELKQQKRLLRNRQAALDSRCRKKEHTQKLEEERKFLLAHLESVEEELNQRRQQETGWLHERQQWQSMVDGLIMEKEELVRQHTLETAELRKKNTFLLEDAHRRTSSISLSAVPSSAGYSSTFSEFDHLSMNDSPTWDDFSFLSNANIEADVSKQDTPVAAAARPKEDRAHPKEDDGSAASGLLLMLLLCGAWAASKSASTTAVMPLMPEDVRAASTTVLENIYKDAGLQVTPNTAAGAPIASSQHHHNDATYNPSADSCFSTFHQQLTAPSRQQQRDEVFSLSATQYNAITTDDSLSSNSAQESTKPRRNLQEALAALRTHNRKGSTSDAYTRSLLWDEVPANVVKDFARMVAKSNREPIS
ncbi:MAG: hypothetical protein Q9217_003384 [Psora testacea]